MATKKKTKDWVPRPLLQFYLWQGTYMTEIQDPTIGPLTGIPTGTGSTMAAGLALQTTYVDAYEVAPPHTHAGKLLIKARNDAAKAFKVWIRAIAKEYLRYNSKLSDYQKGLIGLIPAVTGGGTHTTPGEIVERTIATDYPAIAAKSNSVGTVTFTFHELDTPTRGKPDGMHHLIIYYIVQAITAAAPANPDACTKYLEAQKSPYTKDLTASASGQKLLGFAAWVDTRGVIRHWSPIFSCIIT